MSRTNVDSNFNDRLIKMTENKNKRVSSNDLNLIHYITSLYGNTLTAKGINLLDPIYTNMFFYNKMRSRPLTDIPYVSRTYAFFTRPELNFSFENINSIPFFKWLYTKPIGKMVMSMLTDPEYYINAPGAYNTMPLDSGTENYRDQINKIINDLQNDDNLKTSENTINTEINGNDNDANTSSDDNQSEIDTLTNIDLDSLDDDAAIENIMKMSQNIRNGYKDYREAIDKIYQNLKITDPTSNFNASDYAKQAKNIMKGTHNSIYDNFNFTSPFIPLLMNTCTSVTGAKDLSLQSYEYEEDEFSTKQTVATGMDDLWAPGTLSTTHKDIAYGPVGLLFMLWIFYIHYVSRGYIVSTREHILERILDYTCSIYVFIIGPDGRTIERFGKYTGCYPTSFPLSQQLEHNDEFDPLMLQNMTINWNYNRYEPMNPEILTDFNFVSETEWLFKLTNWDNLYNRESKLSTQALLNMAKGKYQKMSNYERQFIHKAGRSEAIWEAIKEPGMSGQIPRALINGTPISGLSDTSRSDLMSDIWGGFPTIVNGKELIWVMPKWDDNSAKHDRGFRSDDITEEQ